MLPFLILIAVYVVAETEDKQRHKHKHEMQPEMHPLKRLKELTNYTREWVKDNMNHLPQKSSKKWDSRFLHSEKRIKRAFLEFVCEFDDTDLPHGKVSMV